MTKQTFDPHGSLSLPDMLDQAKVALIWHPFWPQIKGTPLENDLPVLMAEYAMQYVKRHQFASLKQCVSALEDSIRDAENGDTTEYAKAVLDAAGVKYVD